MAEKKQPYAERVAEEVIKALEEGTAPWIKPWAPGQQPDRPTNALTGKPYRGWNSVYLSMMQKGDDSRWCTYKQAKEIGGQVRKGESGAVVQYWQFQDKQLIKDEQNKPVLDSEGKKQYKYVELERPKVFHAVVFHASQIDNMPPMPPRTELPEHERHQAAEQMLKASGASIHHDQNDRAFYRPSTDKIHLPPMGQFHTADNYYATALHEVGHWTGHPSRLDRDLSHPFGSEGYAKEELKAEIGSYMLGTELGIGHDPGQHTAYIGSWIKALKEDPNEIFRASRDAEKIVGFMKGLVQEQEQAQTVEQTHEQLVAELEGYSANAIEGYSSIESWQNLEKTAQSVGVKAILAKPVGEQLGNAVVHYEKDGQTLPVITELSGGDGKAVTSVNGQRVQGTGFTSNAEWQSDALTSAITTSLEQRMANSQAEDELQRAMAHEASVRLDPSSTEEDLLAAKDARDVAEYGVINNSKDTQQQNKESERNAEIQEESQQNIAQEKTRLNLPYREKEEAKKLAPNQLLWDKAEKSWYAKPGTDLSKLSKWLPENTVSRQEPPQDPRAEFADALKDAGLQVEGLPAMDGKLHRVAVEGDEKGKFSGAYKGFLDGHPAGFIQNFKTGLKENWKATGQRLNPAEIAKLEKEAAAKRLAREQERNAGYNAKSEALTKELGTLPDAPADHPYLKNKGLSEAGHAFGAKQDEKGNLVVAIEDAAGKVWSAQRIGPNGFKGYEKDAKVSGCYQVLGGKEALAAEGAEEPVLISTGFGTSASIHLATGRPVVVSFQDNNLADVAKEISQQYPGRPVAIIGDDDRHLPERTPPLPNSGREKATEAAKATNGVAIFPQFTKEEKGREFTDFSDLHRTRGLAAVQRQVETGLAQAKHKAQSREENVLAKKQEIESNSKGKQQERPARSKAMGHSL